MNPCHRLLLVLAVIAPAIASALAEPPSCDADLGHPAPAPLPAPEVRPPSSDALHRKPLPPKLLRISGEIDGSGVIKFTRAQVCYEHKHWAPPEKMIFDGEPWDDLRETPAAWLDYSDRLDLTKAKIIERHGRDVTALELTPDGFDLYLADSPNGSAHYEVVLAIPRRPRVPAVTLDMMQRHSATVEVLNMRPIPLAYDAQKPLWSRIPEAFLRRPASILMPEGSTQGVADYRITKGGWLIVACNYGYQGNNSGDWPENRWKKQDFLASGWTELSPDLLGGTLVKGDNREQTLFAKDMQAGDTGRLRCNKHDPPYFIQWENQSGR